MKHFPFKGYSAMAWCGCIITREPDMSDITLRHERIHQMQAFYYKRYYSYYLRYLWQWLKGNPFAYPSQSAYYTNPYEMEAYANQLNKDYYPRKGSWRDYSIRKRKSTYKRHRNAWIAYCQELAKEVRS